MKPALSVDTVRSDVAPWILCEFFNTVKLLVSNVPDTSKKCISSPADAEEGNVADTVLLVVSIK